ncbi:MAG: hypothetical protein HRT44_08855, partial [Bdellovibrionales bacterium]|nr:hypothetical protein [Bdellovibrionales bacterium]NQZ19350.1 hypothetical protein [Bdellovibrionales bacterium]
MKLMISFLSILMLSQAAQACFGQLASSMSQGISQQMELENTYADRLMEMASNRNEIEKDCRGELLDSLIKFREAKVE